MVDHGDTSKELRHKVILIRVEALVQCSANHSIAVECVIARVCGHVPLSRRRRRPLPFYISRVGPYSGTFILLDKERERGEREGERSAPRVVVVGPP